MIKSKLLLGRLLAEKIKDYPVNSNLNDVEFSVFSQFGEDGIIQFITHHLRHNIKNKIFIEIGVENYSEANTRFLLENDVWQGVVIDSSHMDVKQIRGGEFYWRNNLFAQHAFVTKDNVNELLESLSLPSEIGLLSIDIDGNDYWVLDSIELLKPAIIIVEYNSFFGHELPITLPYRENFIWRKFHPPTYFGASLPAFCHLLENKNYELLGSTAAGNNAFFVHKDVNKGILKSASCKQAYKKAIFNSIHCDSTDKFTQQLKCLKYQQVFDVQQKEFLRLNGEAITSATVSKQFNCVNDFLPYEDRDFILNIYQYVLCREPDNEGFNSHLSELRRGVSKQEILRRIIFSTEGKNVGVILKSLDKHFTPDLKQLAI